MLSVKSKVAVLVSTLMLTAPAFAQNAAIVNGQSISSELVDFIVAEQAKRGAPAGPELRTTIRQELINQEVMRQEAMKKGLGSKPSVKFQMQMMNQAILANSLREDFYAKNKMTEAEVKDAYAKIAKMMGGSEYRASHILVEKEADAKDIITQLDKGADFSKIAADKSKDPGSAANGGDLDWANPQSFVPEFSQAMVGLQKGKYTKSPVKSQFGYHVILLTDVRESAPPPLDEIRQQLEGKLLNDKWEAYQADLLKSAKIK